MQKAGHRDKAALRAKDRRPPQKADATVPVFLVLALLILAAGIFCGRQRPFFRNSGVTTPESPARYVWITGSAELQDGLHRFSVDELESSSWGKDLLAAAAKGVDSGSPVQAVRYDGTMFQPERLPPVVANVFFQPIPINRAAKDVLVSLPGIGPVLAARIVQHRKEHGPFMKTEELLQVSGIGPKKFAALAGQIVLD